MIIYGQLYDIVSLLRSSATFIVNTELVQKEARGTGDLTPEALEALKNDPRMDNDTATMVFGGYGKATIKIPVTKLFNREEKQELAKALSLHKRFGKFSTALLDKYDTTDPIGIACKIAEPLVGQTRIAMIKGRDKMTGALDIRMVTGRDEMVQALRPCVRQEIAVQT